MDTFIFQSKFQVPIERLFQFHEDPIGFETLMKTNRGIRVIQKPGSIKVGETAILKVPIFPFIYTEWIAKHTKYEKNSLFQDNQEKGPFLKFLHTHRFIKVNENESILSDEIEIDFYLWPISRFFIYPMLYFMFKKRHNLTAKYFSVKPNLIFSGYSRTIIN
ncbi:MAG: hypothetical protein IBJ01_11020 [Leptospira sp.]|uniref:Cell division inhibitor n=1 Tax=Leptospira paudalimensis TaxID=2950024 RepID=A0ABT3M6H2_9LEPT|nr:MULTISPECIES: hypothetical protein [Leptospira]MBL0955288.1 hypothetical protein [Leptospira sp.]MCW7503992.1 hypothetical protein [Leptospira paudalimensis]